MVLNADENKLFISTAASVLLDYLFLTNIASTESKRPGPADHSVKHVNLPSRPSYTCRKRVKPSYPDSVTYDRGVYTIVLYLQHSVEMSL